MKVHVKVAEGAEGFERALQVRVEVFVREQGFAREAEVDARDREAVHLLAEDEGGRAVGTARLYPASRDGVARVGRVAVLAEARGTGLGALLMGEAEAEAARRGYREIVLDAQTRVRGFYARLGYSEEGDEFEEEGVPHVRMRRKLGN